VVNVRNVPRCRITPRFNADTLPGQRAREGIGYRHLRRLGGLRRRRKSAAPLPNTFWENASLRNYADYAMTDELRIVASRGT
jgi:uncharacterized protein (DUF488 family)